MTAEDQGPDPEAPAGHSAVSGEPFEIGARVVATDGPCGELVRVVVDPVAQALTHVVVAPKHHEGLGRLVPIELVDSADAEEVHLSCTTARFHELDDAQDIQFLPPETTWLGYDGPQAMTWPYYSLAMPLGGAHNEPILSDRVPSGNVEIHRGDPVHASDGWIGSVHGLVIDPKDHHVTHVLLAEGHLWGHKQVAIPIGAASRVGEVIRLDLTKEQVKDLPPVELSSSS